ncbi:hypothetical protein GCM10009127_04320 [Alteraurantiacibacter aestuarii]|uniref:DUF465 domain-containing protein n=1 Tax=Alteraurantiacibacter aestuarii TaxID=650004 RepID=A0A844ZKL8_9SPHN|nr:YdcH family protein [Alteraurantiacibacter aestuarii]MXO88318.1 DUF465 domain-containing protein [Alteraurantiacibacter aestuarii]
MTARLYRLTLMHQRIDERLRMELKRRAPDQFALARLKKMKLRVKDLIHRHTPRFAGRFASRPITG